MPRTSTNQGFTLIELLVVISIISILAAMLLPAIGLIREMSRQTSCASKMRQIAMAQLAYTSSNDGIFLCNDGSGVPATLPALEEYDISENRSRVCPSVSMMAPSAVAFTVNGVSYNSNQLTNVSQLYNDSIWKGSNYSFNGRISCYAKINGSYNFASRHISKIKDPDGTVLVFERPQASFGNTWWNGYPFVTDLNAIDVAATATTKGLHAVHRTTITDTTAPGSLYDPKLSRGRANFASVTGRVISSNVTYQWGVWSTFPSDSMKVNLW